MNHIRIIYKAEEVQVWRETTQLTKAF